MIFGTWNIMSICRSDSLKVESNDLAEYKLDLVAVQEGRRNKVAMKQQTHFYENGNPVITLGQASSYIRESDQQRYSTYRKR
jgi:hypothetical protein